MAELSKKEVSSSLESRVDKLEKDMAALKTSNAHLFHQEEKEKTDSSNVMVSNEISKA